MKKYKAMEKIKVNMAVDEDQSVIEQMQRSYENCPQAVKYLKKLGVSEEAIFNNLPKINDFVSDINYCKNCPGVKACQKQRSLLVTTISYFNGYLDRDLSPCREFLKKTLLGKQFLVRDFPEEWLDYSLDSLYGTMGHLQVMNRYINHLNSGGSGWIYLNGSGNSGRTFTAAILAVDSAKRKLGPVCFMNCPQRIRELSDLSYRDQMRFQKELDRYCNTPVLVLDDFGNEYKNDFIRDAIVFTILSSRSNNKLITIITSDYSIRDIVALYTNSRNAEIKAQQLGRILKSSVNKEIDLGGV